MISYDAVVTIGFERTLYSVEETSEIVQVGVLVYSGELARQVEVGILSTDGTAMSKSPKDLCES